MAPSKPLRVAIADDHALFRQGLRSLLGMTNDVSVVAETDRAEGILSMVSATPCDILLLDLQMERSSLIDIADVSPQTNVIVVTASDDGAARIWVTARRIRSSISRGSSSIEDR